MLPLLGSDGQKMKLDKTPEIWSFYLYAEQNHCLFLLRILQATFIVAQAFTIKTNKFQIKQCLR